MRYAIIDNERVEATETGQRATCQCCKTILISKCGDFNVKHWSHKSLIECDSWYTNKTEWHIEWQDKFDKKYQEIIIKDEQNVKHIADVLFDDIVIEFQHSPLSYNKIIERTDFYLLNSENIFWVFDYRDTNIDLKHSKKTIFGMSFFTYDINSLSKPIKKFIERNGKELIFFNIDNEYNELYFVLNEKYGFKTNLHNSILRIDNIKTYLLEIINELNKRKRSNESLVKENERLLNRSNELSRENQELLLKENQELLLKRNKYLSYESDNEKLLKKNIELTEECKILHDSLTIMEKRLNLLQITYNDYR